MLLPRHLSPLPPSSTKAKAKANKRFAFGRNIKILYANEGKQNTNKIPKTKKKKQSEKRKQNKMKIEKPKKRKKKYQQNKNIPKINT